MPIYGGHNSGCGNVDRCNKSRNSRVSFLQQGESNMTPVTGIDGTTFDEQ